ncbi:hypothetical protein V8D89_004939 [Ganoderma adspersum]
MALPLPRGARLTGRWEGGPQTNLFPLQEPVSTVRAQRSNFTYDLLNQDRCPFSVHARKVNRCPDLQTRGLSEDRHVVRCGIQLGPEIAA